MYVGARPLKPPVNLRIISINKEINSVTVAWDPPRVTSRGHTNYYLQLQFRATVAVQSILPLSTTTYTFFGLIPDAEYILDVYSTDSSTTILSKDTPRMTFSVNLGKYI